MTPNQERPRYRGPIVVLMGHFDVSSCEDFLLMMKQQDGTCFETEGIAPDVEVRATSAQLVVGDPVLDAALAWLRQNKQ